MSLHGVANGLTRSGHATLFLNLGLTGPATRVGMLCVVNINILDIARNVFQAETITQHSHELGRKP